MKKKKVMMEKIVLKVEEKNICQVTIVTWEGIYDESGKEIPFTQDNAVKLFTDLKDLFDDIYQKASSLDTFKADVGNS